MTRHIYGIKPQGKIAHLIPYGFAPAVGTALCGAKLTRKLGRAYWVLLKKIDDRTNYITDSASLPPGLSPCKRCTKLKGGSNVTNC